MIGDLEVWRTAADDDGAHQAAHGALERFPSAVLALGTIASAQELLRLPADNSGQVLQLLTLLASPADLQAFNTAFGPLEPGLRGRLADLVHRHEQDEWLAGDRSFGRLRAE
ncbi:hypothetical protein ABZX92_38615 [Lentzea sp. NPDC006480]|uniref:hypothetical protein n=1 Tax=Lentzea sp. NPDC006480 TaxID=3157176 RepID=UPI0033BF0E83